MIAQNFEKKYCHYLEIAFVVLVF